MSFKRKLKEVVENFSGRRVAVLGDLILDRYLFGAVERISPEAPVPVLRVEKEEYRPGGAANVAQNVALLKAESLLAGICGLDNFGRQLEELTAGKKFFIRRNNCQTILKTRIIAQRQQLLRIDRDHRLEIERSEIEELLRQLEQFKPEAIIISDYAKGFVNRELISELLSLCRQQRIEIFVDPKKPNYELYRGVTAITPNRREAEEMLARFSGLKSALQKIINRWQTKYALITLGADGICGKESGRRTVYFPAFSHEVFDVTGAGDTVIAVFALAIMQGGGLKVALFLANLAASLVVEKIGTVALTPGDLLQRIDQLTANDFKTAYGL